MAAGCRHGSWGRVWSAHILNPKHETENLEWGEASNSQSLLASTAADQMFTYTRPPHAIPKFCVIIYRLDQYSVRPLKRISHAMFINKIPLCLISKVLLLGKIKHLDTKFPVVRDATMFSLHL